METRIQKAILTALIALLIARLISEMLVITKRHYRNRLDLASSIDCFVESERFEGRRRLGWTLSEPTWQGVDGSMAHNNCHHSEAGLHRDSRGLQFEGRSVPTDTHARSSLIGARTRAALHRAVKAFAI
jgi:hypothetical protein